MLHMLYFIISLMTNRTASLLSYMPALWGHGHLLRRLWSCQDQSTRLSNYSRRYESSMCKSVATSQFDGYSCLFKQVATKTGSTCYTQTLQTWLGLYGIEIHFRIHFRWSKSDSNVLTIANFYGTTVCAVHYTNTWCEPLYSTSVMCRSDQRSCPKCISYSSVVLTVLYNNRRWCSNKVWADEA